MTDPTLPKGKPYRTTTPGGMNSKGLPATEADTKMRGDAVDKTSAAQTKDTAHKDAQGDLGFKTAKAAGIDTDKTTGLLPGASVPRGAGDQSGVARPATDQGSGNNPVRGVHGQDTDAEPSAGIDTAG